MKKSAIIFYWALLLVPTFLIGLLSLNLLRHEDERIRASALSAATEKVRSIAGNIELAILEVQDELTASLQALDESSLTSTLHSWERGNPLIRNVFVWEPNRTLLLPNPQDSLNEEERQFVGRYEALFAGRVPLERPARDTGQPVHQEDNIGYMRSRMQLKQLAKEPTQVQQRADWQQTVQEPTRSGWLPWHDDNHLYMLGWLQRGTTQPVFGVELEMVALLSRLISVIPPAPPAGKTYALIDGNGEVFYQSGNREITPDAIPFSTWAIGPSLPHWQVAVYTGGPVGSGARGFMLLSGLMVAIFVVAIVSGGFLLFRQAERNLRDARQKTTFVSNVSHELKTPLTTIRMYAELLGEGRVTEELKKERYMKVIIEESQRLTRLVNNVLDFSRLEQDRKTYHREELDLSRVLRGIMEAQQVRLVEAGMELECNIPDEPIMAYSDRDALEQTILNLLDNAIKYAADGKSLKVELIRGDQLHEIRVQDRGPGIQAMYKERVFDKFYRIDDSLTANTSGSGLGLSISRRLMRDLGGNLSYETAEDGGACFKLVISSMGVRSKA